METPDNSTYSGNSEGDEPMIQYQFQNSFQNFPQNPTNMNNNYSVQEDPNYNGYWDDSQHQAWTPAPPQLSQPSCVTLAEYNQLKADFEKTKADLKSCYITVSKQQKTNMDLKQQLRNLKAAQTEFEKTKKLEINQLLQQISNQQSIVQVMNAQVSTKKLELEKIKGENLQLKKELRESKRMIQCYNKARNLYLGDSKAWKGKCVGLDLKAKKLEKEVKEKEDKIQGILKFVSNVNNEFVNSLINGEGKALCSGFIQASAQNEENGDLGEPALNTFEKNLKFLSETVRDMAQEMEKLKTENDQEPKERASESVKICLRKMSGESSTSSETEGWTIVAQEEEGDAEMDAIPVECGMSTVEEEKTNLKTTAKRFARGHRTNVLSNLSKNFAEKGKSKAKHPCRFCSREFSYKAYVKRHCEMMHKVIMDKTGKFTWAEDEVETLQNEEQIRDIAARLQNFNQGHFLDTTSYLPRLQQHLCTRCIQGFDNEEEFMGHICNSESSAVDVQASIQNEIEEVNAKSASGADVGNFETING